MRLLLRYTNRGQHVKNFPALDFQLTGQIVNSNLTHPLLFPLVSRQPRVSKLAYLTSLKPATFDGRWANPVDEPCAFGSVPSPNSPILAVQLFLSSGASSVAASSDP